MKKTILIALILALALSLFACSDVSEVGDECCKVYNVTEDYTLVMVVNHCEFELWVHKETGVMYISRYGNYQSGFSVMLDANGDPLIWKGENK